MFTASQLSLKPERCFRDVRDLPKGLCEGILQRVGSLRRRLTDCFQNAHLSDTNLPSVCFACDC